MARIIHWFAWAGCDAANISLCQPILLFAVDALQLSARAFNSIIQLNNGGGLASVGNGTLFRKYSPGTYTHISSPSGWFRLERWTPVLLKKERKKIGVGQSQSNLCRLPRVLIEYNLWRCQWTSSIRLCLRTAACIHRPHGTGKWLTQSGARVSARSVEDDPIAWIMPDDVFPLLTRA